MSKACSTWPVVVFFLSTVFSSSSFFPPFQGNPRQVWRGGTQMRRSENRGEPRETFASNSRDSQDFEIFFFLPFFSLLLCYSFRPTVASIPTCDLGLFLRAFRDRLSLFLDSSPRSLSRHRWKSSKWLSDFLSFHALGSLTFLVLAPFLVHPCETGI